MMLLLDVMCGGREPRRCKSLTRGKVPRSERKSSLTLGVDGCISMYWERGGCVEADKKCLVCVVTPLRGSNCLLSGV